VLCDEPSDVVTLVVTVDEFTFPRIDSRLSSESLRFSLTTFAHACALDPDPERERDSLSISPDPERVRARPSPSFADNAGLSEALRPREVRPSRTGSPALSELVVRRWSFFRASDVGDPVARPDGGSMPRGAGRVPTSRAISSGCMFESLSAAASSLAKVSAQVHCALREFKLGKQLRKVSKCFVFRSESGSSRHSRHQIFRWFGLGH
jgi:hypothetical protein